MEERYCISNVSVLDVEKGTVQPDKSVIVFAGKIEAILDSVPDQIGKTISADGLWMCPGLIDCHVHLFLDGSASPRLTFIESSDSEKIRVARANARVAIDAGITTVRDCGSPVPQIFSLQKEIETGETPGPNVISCGQPLTRPKGHCHFMGTEVTTVNEVRRAIEDQLDSGASFVKIMASGGGLTPGTNPAEADFPFELMQASVEVAHANNALVTAHCHATESISQAINASLDMIEHVGFVEFPGQYRYDPKIAERIKDRGIVVSPTVTVALRTAEHVRKTGKSENPADLAALERLEGRLINTGYFHRMGMKIIGGSDGGCVDTPFDSLVDEVLAYVQAGMSNAEALRTITSNGAKYLNLPKVGEIKNGFKADLLLLAGNPFDDLNELRRPLSVFKAGKLMYETDSLLTRH